jgi:signal transduction histidine kinase
MLDDLREAVDLIASEIQVQRMLCQSHPKPARCEFEAVPPSRLLGRLERLLSQHAAVRRKSIEVEPARADRPFRTDPALLVRALINMAVNAAEASDDGGIVRIWTDETDETVAFHAWNAQVMPEAVKQRVFQRFFSTKKRLGRGFGTYSMKLIGETLLGGQVTYTSTPSAGTTFSITLPRDPPGSSARPPAPRTT